MAEVFDVTHPKGNFLPWAEFLPRKEEVYVCVSDSKVRNDLFADDSSLHTRENKTGKKKRHTISRNVPPEQKSMVIATRQRHELSPRQLKLTFEKTRIEQVNEHRLLGAIIDDEMKWQSHLNNLCNTIQKRILLSFSFLPPRLASNMKIESDIYSSLH